MHTNTTSPRRLALLPTLTVGATASAFAADDPMGADTMGGNGTRLDRIERRLAAMDALLRDMAYER